MARNEIMGLHRITHSEAERQGEDAYFKDDYVAAWHRFRDKPTIQHATELLDVAPMLAAYFEGCSPGGQFYELNRIVGDSDQPEGAA